MDDAPRVLCMGVTGGLIALAAAVEVDAAARPDLVRRVRINSTPTVLVLDPDGAIVKRAAGLPRKADVIAALGSVIEPPAPEVTAPAVTAPGVTAPAVTAPAGGE